MKVFPGSVPRTPGRSQRDPIRACCAATAPDPRRTTDAAADRLDQCENATNDLAATIAQIWRNFVLGAPERNASERQRDIHFGRSRPSHTVEGVIRSESRTVAGVSNPGLGERVFPSPTSASRSMPGSVGSPWPSSWRPGGIGCVETAQHTVVAAAPADIRGSAFGLLAAIQAGAS
jgi:hypothetical protein